MYIVTQNKCKYVNLDRYDYLELSDSVIYAYQGDRYVILGRYDTEEEAKTAFSKILSTILGDSLLM